MDTTPKSDGLKVKLSIDYLKGKICLHYHEDGPNNQRTYNKSCEGPDELDGQIGQILAENESMKSAFSVEFTDGAVSYLEKMKPEYCSEMSRRLGIPVVGSKDMSASGG